MDHRTHDTTRAGRALAGAGALLALGLGLLLPEPASAQRRFRSDPVERLREVLVNRKRYDPFVSPLDKDYADKLKASLGLFEKKLDEATGKQALRSASDLSAALLLIEWDRDEQVLRTTEARRALGLREGETVRQARRRMSYQAFRDAVTRLYDREKAREGYPVRARALEFAARARLTNRFVAAVKRHLDSGDPIRQVAVCHLILETMGGAIEQLEEPLPLYDAIVSPFAEPLERLAEGKGGAKEQVRVAALLALGRFHTVADRVAPAYAKALDPSQPDAVRKAAADGVEGLIYSATGADRLRGSEPGVSVRESRRTNQALSRDLRLTVAAAVVPAAAKGLGDRSVAIREQCATAEQLAANALFDEIRRQVPAVLSEPVLDEKAEVELPVSELAPVMKAFAAQGPALRKAFADPRPQVRLEALRAAEALGRAYSLLQSIRKAKYSVIDTGTAPPLPKLPEFKEKMEPEKPGLGAARRPRLRAVLARRRQEKEKAPLSPKLLDESEEALGKLLKGLRAAAGSGLDDPDPKSRRAAAEAIESLGDLGEPSIPRLVEALKDHDVFVRWIAARALGKLAKRPREVVPALAANFDDEDLDARIAALKAVARFGPDAVGAAPALGERLGSGDAEIRLAALKALESIGPGGKAALPGIAALFDHPDPRVRTGAASLVGQFEEDGKPYLPGLRKLVDDPDQDVRRAASGAILAIED